MTYCELLPLHTSYRTLFEHTVPLTSQQPPKQKVFTIISTWLRRKLGSWEMEAVVQGLWAHKQGRGLHASTGCLLATTRPREMGHIAGDSNPQGCSKAWEKDLWTRRSDSYIQNFGQVTFPFWTSVSLSEPHFPQLLMRGLSPWAQGVFSVWWFHKMFCDNWEKLR